MLSPISPSSDIYPDGLPSDYSVIATFKVPKDTAKTSWNLWQVSDPEGRDQVGLRFQGDSKTLDFFYTSPQGTQMLRTFQRVEKLFDGEWHKLALSAKGEQVKLLVDCEEVSVEPLDEPRPVIRQGFTSIVKRAVGDRSVSVSTWDRLEYLSTLQGIIRLSGNAVIIYSPLKQSILWNAKGDVLQKNYYLQYKVTNDR